MFIYKVTNHPDRGSDIRTSEVELLRGEQKDFQENTARWLVDTYRFLTLSIEEVPDLVRKVEPTIEKQLEDVKKDIKELKEKDDNTIQEKENDSRQEKEETNTRNKKVKKSR